jgi:hypothetical protein
MHERELQRGVAWRLLYSVITDEEASNADVLDTRYGSNLASFKSRTRPRIR